MSLFLKRMNNKGFSLLESLLVLFILSLLLLIPPTVSSSYKNRIQEELFLYEVKKQISFMQNYAVVTGDLTSFRTFPEYDKINFRLTYDRQHPYSRDVYLPETVSLEPPGRLYTFQRKTGYNTELERITFNFEKEKVEIVFQMGGGKYYVERSER